MAYDAFMSHNSCDRGSIERIAVRLQQAGLSLFLDRWNLRPGDSWQESLELAIELSRACLVFIGPSGLGPWEIEEMRAAIDQRARNPSFRVVPVLLPGFDETRLVQLPAFLRRFHSVAFQGGIDDANAIAQLVTLLKSSGPVGQLTSQGPKRHLVCLSGPSAVGKDVLLYRLLNRLKNSGIACGLVRKYTTRARRPGEEDLNPFDYLTEDNFLSMFRSGSIGCRRYSYGNWYGIDTSFKQGLSSEEVLLVSQRLYKEISTLRSLAEDRGIDVFAVLMKSDRRSLISRSLHRSLSNEQRNRRMAQVLEDLDFLDAEPGIADLFEHVADNGDGASVMATEESIWNSLCAWLLERNVPVLTSRSVVIGASSARL